MAGISNGQAEDDEQEYRFSSDMTLEDLRLNIFQFCNERNWLKHHTPRNVLLAMVGEVGELSELFQWKGEVKKGLPEFSEEEKKCVGQEISDVMMYLVYLASICHVDLPAALHAKMQLNAEKYPKIADTTSSTGTTKFSLYGEQRSLIGAPVPPDRAREEGDGSE